MTELTELEYVLLIGLAITLSEQHPQATPDSVPLVWKTLVNRHGEELSNSFVLGIQFITGAIAVEMPVKYWQFCTVREIDRATVHAEDGAGVLAGVKRWLLMP